MNKLVFVTALAACVSAWPKTEEELSLKTPLKHFDVSSLTDEFKNYELPDSTFNDEDEDCDVDKVRQCIKCVHDHARVCVKIMHAIPEIIEKVHECEEEGSDIADRDQAWQEKSSHWHAKVAECLDADRPDEPVEDSLFFARRKRSAFFFDHDHHGHADVNAGCGSYEEDYENTMEDHEKCWSDMRQHRGHCNTDFRQCPRLAACLGLAIEDSQETSDASWNAYMRGIVNEKKDAIVAHKRDLLVCTGKIPAETPHEHVRSELWGDAEK